MTESELIAKIKNHELGNAIEAFELYNLFCDILKKKYGLVNKDYDENPTKRGSEWLDIHHILEYELGNISGLTKSAKFIEQKTQNHAPDEIIIKIPRSEFHKGNNYEIPEIYKEKTYIYACEPLGELKKYNAKDQLVYANKIEHFLLHYLIDSIRGQKCPIGGTNIIWDSSISLDIYDSDQKNYNNLKRDKNFYYSIMSSYDITFLYRKLIDWKGSNIKSCSIWWTYFNSAIRQIQENGISYIENKEKLFTLLKILGYRLDEKLIEEIDNAQYTSTSIKDPYERMRIKSHDLFRDDGKTVIRFSNIFSSKSFTIPRYAEKIGVGAFDFSDLEKITIPTHVESIEERAFIDHRVKMQRYPLIKTIYYKGTKEEWDSKFSNVILNDIKLICKMQKKEKPTAPLTEKQLLYKQIITLIEQGEPVDKSPLNDMIKKYRALYGNN